MPILGIVAAAGGFTKFGDFYQIATSTASTGAVSSISFTNIPQDYTHLQIRALNFTTNASGGCTLRFNNDTTTSNYYDHALYGNGATASSTSDANNSYAPFFAGGSATSQPGVMILDILDYTNTNKFKTARQLNGYTAPTGNTPYLGLISNLWKSTSAINRIDITPGATFSQYTHFALYGIKA